MLTDGRTDITITIPLVCREVKKQFQNHMLSCDDVTKYVGNWGNLAKNGYFTKFDAEKVRKGFFLVLFPIFPCKYDI